jgi:hypothetical protein
VLPRSCRKVGTLVERDHARWFWIFWNGHVLWMTAQKKPNRNKTNRWSRRCVATQFWSLCVFNATRPIFDRVAMQFWSL